MGELHLQIVRWKLENEHRVNVRFGTPQVALKETITDEVEEEYSAEALPNLSCFAKVRLRLSPLGNYEDNDFRDLYEDDSFPPPFREAIKEGALSALQAGPISGCPMCGVAVELLEAEAKHGESNAVGFKAITSLAVTRMMRDASPILLEPYVLGTVVVPEEFLGSVINELQSRKGELHGIEEYDEGLKVVRVKLALAKTFGLTDALRGVSQGKADFSMTFYGYEPASEETVKKYVYV